MTSNISVDKDTAKHLFEQMLRIKAFGDEVQARYEDGNIPGFVHLDHGHEANHVGIGTAMWDEDWLAVGGARLIGQYIAKGVPLDKVMAELYGRRDGTNSGHGGQMHVTDTGKKLYGHAATIGSGQNPAVGLALAEEMKGTDNVVVTTIGDGGTSRGSFHTALVFAAYWQLPVVFFIENNEWAISTPSKDLAPGRLSDYGIAHKMPNESIDGADVEEVYHTVSEAIKRARNGEGPSVIEGRVSRLGPHFEGDKQTYRNEEEHEENREERDPIVNYRRKLLDAGVLTDKDLDDMRDKIDDEIEEAVAYARDSPEPDPESAYENVYQLPLYGQEE